jgi:3-oxoacyl-[acyl-carrier protein] reductase
MGIRRVVIIGATNPAIRPAAAALAERGIDIAIAAASMDGDEVMAAKRIARLVQQAGPRSMSQAWDVTLPQNIQVSLRQVVKELGAPDGMVYAVPAPGGKPMTKLTDAETIRAFELGLIGAFFATRSFLKELSEDVAGRVVYLSDAGKHQAGDAVATTAAAGLIGMAEALASERPGARATAIGSAHEDDGPQAVEEAARKIVAFLMDEG